MARGLGGESARPRTAARLGLSAAVLTTALAAVSFGVAIFTPPRSGPMCTGDSCITYPYTDITAFFPRDYLWMLPATLLLFVFLVLVVSVHYSAAEGRRPFTLVAIALASMSAALLSTDYFIQLTVIQPSVLRGETDGLAVLSQYNPHGIFIALEALGYLLMSGAMAFMAPAIVGTRGVARAARWVFIAAFGLSVLALIGLATLYGYDLEYRYEIAVIAINWTALIGGGALLSLWFRDELSARVEG